MTEIEIHPLLVCLAWEEEETLLECKQISKNRATTLTVLQLCKGSLGSPQNTFEINLNTREKMVEV